MSDVRCANCNGPIDEPPDLPAEARQPCPTCGGKTRAFEASASDTFPVREKIGFKHRDAKRKMIAQGVNGADLFRKIGKWMHLERFFDHRGDRYVETVTDPETGEVIHQCDEPLSQHQGHGSAKKRR
jgi:hypothetical protein